MWTCRISETGRRAYGRGLGQKWVSWAGRDTLHPHEVAAETQVARNRQGFSVSTNQIASAKEGSSDDQVEMVLRPGFERGFGARDESSRRTSLPLTRLLRELRFLGWLVRLLRIFGRFARLAWFSWLEWGLFGIAWF